MASNQSCALVDLLEKPFTKRRSPLAIILSRNHSSERKKIETDTIIFHEPSNCLSPNLSRGQRKVRDDSKTRTTSRDLSLDLCWGKKKIPDDSRIHASSTDFSRVPPQKMRKIQYDHCPQDHESSKESSRNLLWKEETTKNRPRILHGKKEKTKIQNDHCLRGLHSKKKTNTHGQSPQAQKTKIREDSQRIQKRSKVPSSASPRTNLVGKPTPQSVPRKDTFTSMEEYVKNSTEIILLDQEEDEDWMHEPLSKFVVPGPVPDFVASTGESETIALAHSLYQDFFGGEGF